MICHTTHHLDCLMEKGNTEREAKMSQEKEPTLLEYVIAYLQEENNGMEHYRPELYDGRKVLRLVKSAIEAYTGGAR